MSNARPSQFAIMTCFAGSTSPPSTQALAFGFDAATFQFVNDGPDMVFLNFGTSSSACSTGVGYPVKQGETFSLAGQLMPIVLLTTTSSGGSSYRVGAWRW